MTLTPAEMEARFDRMKNYNPFRGLPGAEAGVSLEDFAVSWFGEEAREMTAAKRYELLVEKAKTWNWMHNRSTYRD